MAPPPLWATIEDMSYQALSFYNTFLAILSLLAIGGAFTLIAIRLITSRAVKDPEVLSGFLRSWGLWLAALVAVVCTAGSLIYSEVVGFLPCKLCWVQRFAMYPLSVILLYGAWRRLPKIRFVALPLSVVGFFVSAYHYLTQTFPILEFGGSCDPFNPCSAKYVNTFGFISIPFMAGAGFLLIAVLMLLLGSATKHAEDPDADPSTGPSTEEE